MRVLFFSLFFISAFASAQEYKLYGKVTNTKMEPLAFATVQMKGSRNSVMTNENGNYSLQVENGVHELLITMVGYEPRLLRITINKSGVEQNIILDEGDRNLANVTVKSLAKDKAEEYIRHVIKHKDALQNAAGAYSCNIYIKAVQEDSTGAVKKKKEEKNKADSLNKDLKQMAMAEIAVRMDYQPYGKYKEERKGIAKRGNVNNLFYLTITDGRFDLYENLVRVPSVAAIPFVSPVSYSGLIAYKYKTLKIQKSGNHNIYTISFRPAAVSNATLLGELIIDDSAWVLLETKFTLPKYHLPVYDYFEVSQQYEFVNNQAWMITKEQFVYYSKANKTKASGNTIAYYKDFEFNKEFDKKYFGQEISATTESAYKKDSTFWSGVRQEPLSDKQIRFIRYKDSIYAYTHSKAYLDSVDKKLNKITWQKLLYMGQPLSNHEKGTLFTFPSLSAMINPFSFGGFRVQMPFSFIKMNPENKRSLSLYSKLSYGFLNKDVNGDISVQRKYNAFNQAYYTAHIKRDFASIFAADAWINQMKRTNYYLDNSIGVGWGRELLNGLVLNLKADMALRRSLSGYKTYSFMDSVFYPLDSLANRAPSFTPYNAFYSSIELRYTPFQPYIREPNEKIILDSKWPTLYVQWRKGVPRLFNSAVNFDYLEFALQQYLRLGTAGISSYTIKSGSFLNKKDVRLIDYKFQRRGDPYLFLNPNEAFQSLDSTFPVFKRFYEGHYLHEFNGAILNKIPLLKKIGLREVAGTGFLLAQERNLRYVEAFAGVERVFKMPFQLLQKIKVGIYVVGSLSNQFKNPVQFKFGITGWDSRRNRWN